MAAKYGTRGSDSLTASASGTELYGLAGNDTLRSGSFTGVSLFGEEGNDSLYAKDTDLLIDGGAGVDTAYFAVTVSRASLLDTHLVGVENIVITNTTTDAAYDFSAQTEGLNITGNRKVDSITGGSSNDTITGGLGGDSLYGGAGNDLLVAEATDALIDGGDGTDTVRFTAAVKASDLGNADLINVEKVEIAATVAAQYDFSAQSEALNITGSKFADTIIGGVDADTLAGGAGNDRLEATSSDALVDGGEGIDTVVYAADVSGLNDGALVRVEKVVITNTLDGSYDFLLQSESLDITGTKNNDTIYGGRGADMLRGGLGDDALYAGENDTLIDGGNGTDTVYFKAGVSAKKLLDSELVSVEKVEITNQGNAAYDFSVQSEKLSITGGAGADTITGGKGVDTILGGHGNDLIVATDIDVIDGGNNTDTVRFTAAVSAVNLGDADLVNVENIELSNRRAALYDCKRATNPVLAR